MSLHGPVSLSRPLSVMVESVDIVLLLMSIENPSEKVRNAVEYAVAWFEASKIYNTKIETVDAPEMVTPFTVSKHDKVVVNSAGAPAIWTRYYELKHTAQFSVTAIVRLCTHWRRWKGKDGMDMDGIHMPHRKYWISTRPGKGGLRSWSKLDCAQSIATNDCLIFKFPFCCRSITAGVLGRTSNRRL